MRMEEAVEANKSHNSPQASVHSYRGSSPAAGTGPPPLSAMQKNLPQETAGRFSASGIANWAKSLRINPNASQDAQSLKSPLSFFSSGFGKRSPSKIPVVEAPPDTTISPSSPKDRALGTFTRGFLDTSKNAVKAVQIKARHIVSQNKRRYQEGGFDLDMTYITENIIAMGFPAGDISSGFLGYVEGFYRNHMEEVIKFFEFRHKDKYKVYNLCSERLYDASLFEGKVACFPFDDHNCPPLQLITAFCQSAYAWLKGDLENVVVVHCKAGMARTGLMISSLLLYLKFFPTAEESIAYYNQKRCVDGKGLVLPSQVRYVKYFERVLRNCDGETPIGRMVMLRGFRLHKCPYWIRPSITLSDHNGILFSTKKHPRTKDLMPEDYWFSAPRKGVMVFALPGERGLTDLNGDFKIHFHDRHGDFYCWLNTNMMENRTVLTPQELDGFDKRKLPSPGFQVEVVILDNDGYIPFKKSSDNVASVQQHVSDSSCVAAAKEEHFTENATEVTQPPASEGDEIFSDSESEESNKNTSSRQRGIEDLAKHDSEGSQRPWTNTEHVTPNGRLSSAITAAAAATDGTDGSVVNAKDRLVSQHNAESPIHDMSRKGVGETEQVDASMGNHVADKEEEGTEPSVLRKDRKEQVMGKVKLDTTLNASDFKAIAADASVFTFGDDEDYESDM